MGRWFSNRTSCGSVHHTADDWDDVIYWNYQFTYTCYDMAAYTASYLRNVCLAMILVVDKIDELEGGEPPEPYELTMDAIINVMLTAEPAQVEYFVGLVDAYRQSIWNKPFNEDFFAALARGFE